MKISADERERRKTEARAAGQSWYWGSRCRKVEAHNDGENGECRRYIRDGDGDTGQCVPCAVSRSERIRHDDPEGHRSACRAWRLNNVEKRRVDLARWQRDNPEKRRANEARWRRNNPSRNRARNLMRRGRSKVPISQLHREHLIAYVVFRDFANDALEANGHGRPFSIEHVCPLHGKTVCGLHVPHNLLIEVLSDNISKGNRLDERLVIDLPREPGIVDLAEYSGGEGAP